MFGFLKNAIIAAAAALMIGSGAAGAVTFNLATNGGSGGGTNLPGAPNAFNLSLTSNDNLNSISTTWTALADQAYLVSFDWSYFTSDRDGSTFDKFGYFVGATFTQLSTDGLSQFTGQNGAANFLVAAGQSFGFYITNFVQGFGPGFATANGTLQAQAAVVPVPAAGFLLLAGLAGLGLMRTRRRLAA